VVALEFLKEAGYQVGTGVMIGLPFQTYENKPCLDEDAELCTNCLETRVELAGAEIGYNEWGDSQHFLKRNGK